MTTYQTLLLLGIVLILLAFVGVQAGRLRGTALPFQSINALGALLVLAAQASVFRLATFLLALAWLAASIYGIARNRRDRRRP